MSLDPASVLPNGMQIHRFQQGAKTWQTTDDRQTDRPRYGEMGSYICEIACAARNDSA